MRKLFLLSFLLICAFSNSQINFFVEATGDFSLISASQARKTEEVQSDKPNFKKFQTNEYHASYDNRLGAGIVGGMNYFFKEYFSFDAGLGVDNVNFRQKLRNVNEIIYFHDSANETGFTPSGERIERKSEAAHNLLLLSVPLSISYYLLENNLSVSVGMLPGFVLLSTGGYATSRNFNKFQLGIQVQLKYQIQPQWWIVGGFQEYSTKLYKPELKQSYSNLRKIKLGIKYDF